ncbi:MAG: hyperosmotically inducible periplasmic protein [Acidobacteriota bacterium]|jgi:hyperosmotically inducible protein|nr:hyperosmotically inducible periplasmic protein [Acidobacteriota bacterium]
MRSKTILSILAGAALCLTAAGCGSDDNTNVTVNVNRAANANAVATPAATATPAGSAYNRNYNSKEDYNKEAANYKAEAKNAGSSIGSGLEDGWIHLKVRAALAAVNDLRDSTINVDVDNNVVTLRGTVPNAASKKAAEDAAKKVEGVKSVTDKLEVKAVGSSNKAGNANAANANTKK